MKYGRYPIVCLLYTVVNKSDLFRFCSGLLKEEHNKTFSRLIYCILYSILKVSTLQPTANNGLDFIQFSFPISRRCYSVVGRDKLPGHSRKWVSSKWIFDDVFGTFRNCVYMTLRFCKYIYFDILIIMSDTRKLNSFYIINSSINIVKQFLSNS